MAIGACLLVAALGPRPRATRFDLLLSRAAMASGAGQPSAALAWLDEAIAFDPALAALHVPAARLALQAGDTAAMRQHLLAAPPMTRSSSEYRCLVALLPSEEAPEALPPSAGCAEAMATPRLASAEIPSQAALPAAAAALRLQLETRPEDLPGWERLAALTELTDAPAVEAVILQAYRYFPEGSDILDGLWLISHEDTPKLTLAERSARAGQLLAATGDWALAGAAWTRAVDLEPAFPQARAFLGVAMGQTGADGLPPLLLASAEAPDDPVIRLLLGQYLLSGGNPAAAARQLEYASHLDPENPAIAAALGAALAQVGRLDEAAAAYLRAAARDPQDPAFWLLLAEFALHYDYQVESLGIDAARNAVALSPQDPAALSALGMADSLVGDRPTGERLLRSAISLDPSNPLGWYRYALVVLEQGRVDEAREALATAVTLDPDGIVGGLAQASLANLAGGLR
jgi:tetratricopeptide (TPR) repeat protein